MKSLELTRKIWKVLEGSIPRILSQLDRDPDSPTFGCFDRNFWHYKIRDFPSIILQQGMIILDVLYHFNGVTSIYCRNEEYQNWINGAVQFWARYQNRNGSFNEYYPFEQGFPPTAFSLYAIGLILRTRNYSDPGLVVKRTIEKTIKWLLSHPEKQAANQEIAGLAGIALCSKLPGMPIKKNLFAERLDNFFASQSSEGWFPEYGGPDLGYLSVTIDCLWDYYEITTDSRAKQAIRKAVDFINKMFPPTGYLPSMINTRNTDYIVPYGITRFANEYSPAAILLERLFTEYRGIYHYLKRTDDRYTCHYIYQSCFRALQYGGNVCEPVHDQQSVSEKLYFLSEAGIYIDHRVDCSIYCNARKGGILYVIRSDGSVIADYGWRIPLSHLIFAVSHWQDDKVRFNLQNEFNEKHLQIEGRFYRVSYTVSSPLKHILLRILSWFLGNRIIPSLKKRLILSQKGLPMRYMRKIIFNKRSVVIEDVFNVKKNLLSRCRPAKKYSLRYVASAGLFSEEELEASGPSTYWQKEDSNLYRKEITL